MKKTLNLIYTEQEAEYLAKVGREKRRSSDRRKFPTAKSVLHAVLMRADIVRPIEREDVPSDPGPDVDAPGVDPAEHDLIPAKNPPVLPASKSEAGDKARQVKTQGKRRSETISKRALPIVLSEAKKLGVSAKRILRGFIDRAMRSAHPAE